MVSTAIELEGRPTAIELEGRPMVTLIQWIFHCFLIPVKNVIIPQVAFSSMGLQFRQKLGCQQGVWSS